MKWNYQHLLPAGFAPDSRVWIYQATRIFSIPEALEAEQTLHQFAATWKSHGDPVKGYANLFFGQFIILMADERATGVSGCSTDSSVRMLKQLESRLGVELFDRQQLAFVREDKVQLLPLSQLDYAVKNGFITGDTLFFNNMVQTKSELESNWLVPARKSWLAARVPFENPVG